MSVLVLAETSPEALAPLPYPPALAPVLDRPAATYALDLARAEAEEGEEVLVVADAATKASLAEVLEVEVGDLGSVDVEAVRLVVPAEAVARDGDGDWRRVRTPEDLLRATLELVAGDPHGPRLDEGLVVGEGTALDGVAMIGPPVWIGEDVELGMGVRLDGPVAIGAGAAIGDGSHLSGCVVLPGAEVAMGTVLRGGLLAGVRG